MKTLSKIDKEIQRFDDLIQQANRISERRELDDDQQYEIDNLKRTDLAAYQAISDRNDAIKNGTWSAT